MDIVHSITKQLDHNRYVMLVVAFAVGIILVFVGCAEPKVINPITQVKATETEIIASSKTYVIQQNAAINALMAEYQQKLKAIETDTEVKTIEVQAALDAIAEQKQFVADVLVTTQGIINTLAPQYGNYAMVGIGLIGSAFGLGSFMDKRRADRRIVDLKSELTNGGSTTGVAGA